MTITTQTLAVVEGVATAMRDHTDRVFDEFDRRLAAVERRASTLAARIIELEARATTERDPTDG